MNQQNTAKARLSAQKRELLALLLEKQGIGPQSTIPRRAQLQDPPLSFAQQRLWMLDQMEPNTGAYDIGFAVRAKGNFNERAFEETLQHMIRRHEALRTTFTVVGDQPVQHIAENVDVPLTRLDYSARPDAEAAIATLIRREFSSSFDLARGPLLRVTLARLAEAEHVLIFCMHHIIGDGWSLGLVLKEISEGYAAYALGQQPALPELPIQYADYALWQRNWLEGERLQDQLAFWRQQLAGAPPVLELPTDRLRPPLQTVNGADQRMSLGPELTESIKQLSRRENVTPFMMLLAGFSLLLSQYANQDDVVVGTPVAGRSCTETEGLIGLFLNMLVLRTSLSGSPTVRELLARAKETALGAFANQDVTFERLVEELHPQRDLSRSPLFQVLFVVQNAPIKPLQLPGLVLDQVSTADAMTSSKFDLTVDVAEMAGEFCCRFEYNTDLFDEATISRMMQHFGRTMQWLVKNIDTETTVDRVPLLDEQDQQNLLVTLNSTAAEYPNCCIHELFERSAELAPEKIAVSCAGAHLTYGELDRCANQFGHYLSRLGVGPETLIGVCLERSIDLLVALLGLMKAGAAYVPLDPMFPADRLRYMAEDAQLKFIITQQSLRDTLSWSTAEVICIDGMRDEITQRCAARPSSGATPKNLAYVLYTSGSTGRPKGVMIEHAAVVNFLTSMALQPGVTSGDTLLAVTTLSFDIAGLELYLPLAVGGRIEIAPREVLSDSSRLQLLLRDSKATVMQATPATWRLLIDGGWAGDKQLKVLCGGEALSAELAQQLLERCGELWNVYGPTETTIWSSCVQMRPGETINLGRPIANTQFYVLDEQLQPVPIGIPGELWIGGDGLARGYWNRPQLTAERFVTHVFPGIDHPVRIYRTGDQVRYRNNLTLQYLGRLDGQIKLRGYRIELGEIEAVLSQTEGVKQCAVVLRQDGGDPRLAAYVVPQPDHQVTATDLRRHLKTRLPEYMMPSAFVCLPQLPLTPNGKIDRRALPVPETLVERGSYLAPRNHLEQAIAEIWSGVLKRREFGIEDNFFEVGGHSLLLTRVHGEIRKRLNVEIGVVDLFRYPTISSLAQHLDANCGQQPQTRIAVDRADFRREMLQTRIHLSTGK